MVAGLPLTYLPYLLQSAKPTCSGTTLLKTIKQHASIFILRVAICFAVALLSLGFAATPAEAQEQAGFSIADAHAVEGETMIFEVTISQAQTETVMVNYATADATPVSATAGTDYTATSGTLMFARGETTKTIGVAIVDDSENEDIPANVGVSSGTVDERFLVRLSSPSGELNLIRSEATGTILDNEGTLATVSASSAVVTEGGSVSFTFAVARSAAESSYNFTLNYDLNISDGYMGSFSPSGVDPSTPHIRRDNTIVWFTYNVADNNIPQSNGFITIALIPKDPREQFSYGVGEQNTVTVEIIDNDRAFSISPVAPTVSEDADSVTLTVALNTEINEEASVQYTTSDGTAEEPGDYTDTSGTLNFAAGETEKTIMIPILPDTVYGEEDETFTVTLSGEMGAGIQTATATVTITDADDSPPVLTVDDVFASEGETLTFTARLTDGSNNPATSVNDVTFTWQTLTQGSTVGRYTSAPATTLTINAGQAERMFTVDTTGNTEQDGNGVVIVQLSNLTGASFIGDPAPDTVTATGTIRDDEALVTEEANKAVLPQVAAVAALQTAKTVGGRVNAAFDGLGNNGVSVHGRGWKQFLAAEAARKNERAELPNLELPDLAFAFAAKNGGWIVDSGGPFDRLGVWGRGYYKAFEVEDKNNAPDFDGSIVGGMIGADTLLTDNVLAGIGFNLFQTAADYETGGGVADPKGTHEMFVWSVHPYFGWRPDTRMTFWGTVGYGMGDNETTETGGDTRKRNVMYMMAGAGGSGLLYEAAIGGGTVRVNAIGDLVLARISEDNGIDSDAGTVRCGFEGEFETAMSGGSSAGVSVELAYRGDFGDTVGGSGLEGGGGVNFRVPSAGVTVNVDGRYLVYHSEEVSEYGFSGNVLWSHGSTGPYALFSPKWGATNDRRDDLWENGANGRQIEAETGERRYNFEAGYSIALPEERGILKIFARSEMELRSTVVRSGGINFKTNNGLSAGFETVSRIGETPEHRGYLRYSGMF